MIEDCEGCKGFSGTPADIDFMMALKALDEREGMTDEQKEKAKEYIDRTMKTLAGTDSI